MSENLLSSSFREIVKFPSLWKDANENLTNAAVKFTSHILSKGTIFVALDSFPAMIEKKLAEDVLLSSIFLELRKSYLELSSLYSNVMNSIIVIRNVLNDEVNSCIDDSPACQSALYRVDSFNRISNKIREIYGAELSQKCLILSYLLPVDMKNEILGSYPAESTSPEYLGLPPNAENDENLLTILISAISIEVHVDITVINDIIEGLSFLLNIQIPKN